MKKIYSKISKRTAFLMVMGLLICVISLGNLLGKSEFVVKNPSPGDPASITKGKDIFINFCSGCHGLRADGKGPQSYSLDPRPQNLRNPQFVKHLSDRRIFFSISGGVRGTAMPAFELMLHEDQRWDAINYVRSLTADNKLNIENGLVQIPIPKNVKNPVKPTAKVLNNGKMNFLYNCASCHGVKGDGKGVTSVNLLPAPRNLVTIKSWGSKPFVHYMSDEWIIDSISNGVPGTSMAPWGAVLKKEVLWSIVSYLRAEAAAEIKRMESSGTLGGE